MSGLICTLKSKKTLKPKNLKSFTEKLVFPSSACQLILELFINFQPVVVVLVVVTVVVGFVVVVVVVI